MKDLSNDSLSFIREYMLALAQACVYALHLRTIDYVHHQSCQSKTTLTHTL